MKMKYSKINRLLCTSTVAVGVIIIYIALKPQLKFSTVTETLSLTVPVSEQPVSITNQAKTGSTGVEFSGTQMRKFPTSKLKFSSFNMPQTTTELSRSDPWCTRWAVMNAAFKPSEAVRRQIRLEGWSLVIVGDRKSPLKYDTGWIPGEGNEAVVYLRPDDQEAVSPPAFVDALPWNHFSRKNVGYFYAIAHGAEVIWDFDDNNMLKFFIKGAAPPGALSLARAIPPENEKFVSIRMPQIFNHTTYNPYPVLGAPSLPSWPRGLPLADIKRKDNSIALKSVQMPKESIAVLQSLADYQPDVDAIFRVTMSTPFFFNRLKETKPLMIPTGVLTPYNAQATLHFRNSFWALLLPVTVNGRVSDIWRSYFSQRLFWDTGLHFGFMARPLVVQDRNQHSNLGDLNAEQDLYMKSESLVRLLSSWSGKGVTLIERIEELWVTLYEHQFIDIHDVELVQLWIQCLLDIGYKFPQIKIFSSQVPSSSLEINNQFQEVQSEDNSCETTKSMTFFTADLHDGSRIDMPSVLSSLGHKVIILGAKKHPPYPFVFNMKGVSRYLNKSDVIRSSFKSQHTRLTESMMKKNFEFYKNDKVITSVDAFFCEFPPSMCEIWMPFNKTIVFIPAHRYNVGRCTEKEWKKLNDHLHMLASMKQPHHVIAASSVYDQEYLHHYTGLKPLPLYSFSGFYTANNPYDPKCDEILLFGRGEPQLALYKTELESLNIIYVKTLYSHYKLSDLVKHRAVVFITYAVMSYKLTELYSLSIPLFIPSMKFYQNVHNFGYDRSALSKWYCRNKTLDNQIKPHPRSTHPYSPNLEVEDDAESEYYWLQFADFYQWPHITYFDNFRDLKTKLKSADFNKIHELMVAENERRRKQLLKTWCRVIKTIEIGRKVPNNYNQAIEKLYNTSRLQVY